MVGGSGIDRSGVFDTIMALVRAKLKNITRSFQGETDYLPECNLTGDKKKNFSGDYANNSSITCESGIF